MSSPDISPRIFSPGGQFISGGGEMGVLMRALDWTRTPVGPPEEWPQSLRTTVGIVLESGYPMYVAWGREYTQFYNDAFRPILGETKHPAALGESARITFPEIWDFVGPLFQQVMDAGQNTTFTDQLVPLDRNNFLENCYFTFSYSPIRAEAGTVGGVFVTVMETTERVLWERRAQALRELAAEVADTRGARAGLSTAAAALARDREDVPFLLLYLLDASGEIALLEGCGGFEDSDCEQLRRVAIKENALFPLEEVARSGAAVRMDDVKQLPPVRTRPWPEAVRSALVLPLSGWGQLNVSGFLVAGISPRLKLDANYELFLQSAAHEVSSALANAYSYEQERRRAEALADLDRAKTTFFTNVSHEFRTPLTLMLGPLEELLNADGLGEEARQKIALAHRNSLRLLKLVNTLLDFSRIEAGRVSAVYEAVDLCNWTCNLCGVFRSAIEKAGLRFYVHCEALPEAVYVDRGMWEKIVLNLLSNAFKFTFDGAISVRQQAEGDWLKLEVQDTGTGIAESELPYIFQRFYRVAGSRGRTFEGTGIGLALSAELVKLHGGTIRVESELSKGSTFTVRIPFGKKHLPPELVREDGNGASSAELSKVAVEESERWLPEMDVLDATAEAVETSALKQRIVVADDNADMRAYVSHLLGSEYEVTAVSNGEEALQAIREKRPSLVLTDVMMPKLDGIGLIRQLRAEDETRSMPVILLSARAGEEARIDGLAAGADDYLQKPFSAKELLARTRLQVQMSLARNQLLKLERSLVAQADAERLRWQTVLMQAPALIAVLRGPNHVFELANPTYLRAVARTSEQLIGKPLLEALPELSTQPIPGILDEVYRTGQAFVKDELCALLDLSGTGILEPRYFNVVYQPSFDMQGQVEGILVHATDVTDQVQARQAAEKSERQLRTLAESIPQLVWSCLPDGQCDYLSTQWVNYTGLPEIEQTGLRWLDLVIHPDDKERVAAAWAAAVNDEAAYDLEYRIRRFDGVYRWFKTRGTPVRDGDGKILKWFGTCTDIEDALKAAEEARRTQAELEATNTVLRQANADLEQFAYAAAHDLQEPLRMVTTYSELLARRLGRNIDEKAATYLTYVTGASGRMVLLLQDLLAYTETTRQSELPAESVDLNNVLEVALANVAAAQAESDAVIEAGALPTVKGREAGFVQLFQNLLSNAIKYRDPNRRLLIQITAEVKDGTARICFQDNGIGIAPEYHQQIFGVFRRLHGAEIPGTGIGLAICQRVVERAGGRLWVESEAGKGAAFVFELPLA